MRKVPLTILAAICLFVIGVFILNMLLWYSSSMEALGEARYAAKKWITYLMKLSRQRIQLSASLRRNAIWRANISSELKPRFGLICER